MTGARSAAAASKPAGPSTLAAAAISAGRFSSAEMLDAASLAAAAGTAASGSTGACGRGGATSRDGSGAPGGNGTSVSIVCNSWEVLRSSDAGPDTAEFASRRSAKANALAMMSLTGTKFCLPVSNCSTSCGSAATALRNSTIMPGVRDRVLSMMRFSKFSIDHPNSAISLAPTIRPLPFRVWKLRRKTPSESKSMGF